MAVGMAMAMVMVMALALVSLSVLASVDKGRDNTDKDRWRPLRYNGGLRHLRLGSLASRAQWTCRDLGLDLVLVPVASGVGEECCSEDGEGVSVGSKTVSISRIVLYIPCISMSLAPIVNIFPEFFCRRDS